MIGTSAADMIRSMRTIRQMSRSAFARLTDVSASTISRIESGKTDPTFSMLQRIAERAGFAFDGELRDTGDDIVVQRTVNKLKVDTAKRLAVRDLPQAAGAARITKRKGARIFSFSTSVSELVDKLNRVGQRPLVSGLEAVVGDARSTRSFTPVIYVEDPEQLSGILEPRSPFAKATVVLLPKTTNVRTQPVFRNFGVDMVDPDWALVDSFASPGRQPEIAREFLPALVGSST